MQRNRWIIASRTRWRSHRSYPGLEWRTTVENSRKQCIFLCFFWWFRRESHIVEMMDYVWLLHSFWSWWVSISIRCLGLLCINRTVARFRWRSLWSLLLWRTGTRGTAGSFVGGERMLICSMRTRSWSRLERRFRRLIHVLRIEREGATREWNCEFPFVWRSLFQVNWIHHFNAWDLFRRISLVERVLVHSVFLFDFFLSFEADLNGGWMDGSN